MHRQIFFVTLYIYVYIYIHTYIYICIYVESVTAPARGGGGGGGRGGRGGGGEREGGVWCSPPTDSPNPLEAAKLHRRTLGLIYGFTQRDPPPHDGLLRGGGQWGGD